MKKMKKIIAVAIAFIVVSTNAHAQQPIAVATATATILSPISIVKNTDMNFGNLTVQPAAGGIVTLEPSLAATRTPSSGGGVSLSTITGTVSAAKFTVTGQALFTYDITLPASATLSNAGNDIIADNFTTSIPSGALDATGSQEFYVGADLTVNAGQAAGVYVTGSPFFVMVAYN
jgi:hypothetical protein